MTGPRKTTRSLPGWFCTCTLVGVAMFMLALCLSPASGRADPYGELTRFGDGGFGESGQINDEQQRLSPGPQLRPHLLGVNATENSVYVLDEPKQYSENKKEASKREIKECEEEFEERSTGAEEKEFEECVEALGLEGPVTRHFRLQKFAASGKGEYEAVASVKFTEESPVGRDEAGAGRLNVEGIAVDPRSKRLYVLAVDVRKSEELRGVDEQSEETVEGSRNEPVAARLFAWEDTGRELVPAGKGGTAELAGPGEGELAAQSKNPVSRCSNPRGSRSIRKPAT